MIIRLGEALDKKNMSAAKFADMLGVSPKQLSRLFRGEADPRISEIIRWAKLLEIEVQDLIEFDNSDIAIITRPSTAVKAINAFNFEHMDCNGVPLCNQVYNDSTILRKQWARVTCPFCKKMHID